MKRSWPLAALAFAAPLAAHAQDVTVDELIVIAPSPFGAADTAINRLPYAVSSVREADLDRTGPTSLLRGLNEGVGQVSINGAQANPFQPNVTYRGFEASPLQGNAQGLAVYVDGVRFNSAFGDTVNWDLIPDAAVQSLVAEGANPVFGLNALGGSLDVRLKTGESYQGLGAELSGGSFGRKDGLLEGGVKAGPTQLYVALRALEEDGWRDFSPSSLRQGYIDFGLGEGDVTAHLKIIAADNDLTGNGASPIELLDARRASVFTHPDRTQNEYQRVSFSTDYKASEALSLQVAIYLQRLQQQTENGDAADIDSCTGINAGFVCSEDDPTEPFEDENGARIPFNGAIDYAFLNRGATDSRSGGFSMQAISHRPVLGVQSRLIVGASYDSGTSDFAAESELGELGADRGYEGPGVVVESDDIGSIGVRASNSYTGFFFSNTFEFAPNFDVVLSGRYNGAHIVLNDRLGGALNGDHHFSRFNPALGFAWRVDPKLSVFGGYSEANRAPTPAELSCADPAAPCSLTNFFVGDPPLKQVVARTFEAGARGSHEVFGIDASWALSAFQTDNQDDIMLIASSTPGRAYFQNVGETRRRGAQADLTLRLDRARIGLSYALLDATFQSNLTLNSPLNPTNTGDQIFVTPGDTMPGAPRNRFKAVVDLDLSDAWSVGGAVIASQGQVLYGDEANDTPKTDDYAVVNLSSSYRLTDKVELFGAVENLFNTDYETFGTFSPVDEVPLAEAPGATDTRSFSPGAPMAIYVGLRFKL